MTPAQYKERIAELIRDKITLVDALKQVDEYMSDIELYEYGVVRGNGDKNSMTCAKIVRAAIAKAEGQP